MSEISKEKFKDSIMALTEEEKIEAIKLFPSNLIWEELFNRNTKMIKKINDIEEILGVKTDTVSVIPIAAWEDFKTRYNDAEDKYSQIKKYFSLVD